MFSVKSSVAIAAVLLISAGGAQAGGRPFVDSEMGRSPATILAWPIEDRGQANLRPIRPAPVSTTRLASQHRPVSKRAPTRLAAVPYPDRRGLFITVALKTVAAGDIRFADRAITSSVSKATPLPTHTGSVKFCVGSMTPCSVSFFPTRTALNVHRTGRMTH